MRPAPIDTSGWSTVHSAVLIAGCSRLLIGGIVGAADAQSYTFIFLAGLSNVALLVLKSWKPNSSADEAAAQTRRKALQKPDTIQRYVRKPLRAAGFGWLGPGLKCRAR